MTVKKTVVADNFVMGMSGDTTPAGIGGGFVFLEIILSSSSGNVFDIARPPATLTLEDFDEAFFEIGDIDIGPIQIVGNITAINEIPEPTTFVLALLATLGLSFYRRRRRRAT